MKKKGQKEVELQTLPKNLRVQLEQTVQEARDIAELAASAALNQIGVGEPNPFPYLSAEERSLRNRLRAHGRQLGDLRNSRNYSQEIDLLSEEVAYEHWHRMLFARFLFENDLLMYPDPDHPVAVSLDECQDLAEDSGARNGWELASRFAAAMLPQVFRPNSPSFELVLPPEHQQKLEYLLNDLPAEVFTASDSLGWVYQFWQTKKKQEVNNSQDKIGSHELHAVTQIFTEPYMVSFLLDNTLGAWWATKRLSDEVLFNAKNESELRRYAAIPGVSLKYLRFVKKDDERWIPASKNFEYWPKLLTDLKVLDPCCGSGHFLVAVFLMLVPMRMHLEGLSPREATEAVIRDNLYGLDIDQRVTEIAAFALALNAWRYPNAGGYRKLPELNIACSGLSVSVSKHEWQEVANGDQKLSQSLGMMYELMKDAPLLGSLIGKRRDDAYIMFEWDTMGDAIQRLLEKERTDEEREVGVTAHGLVRASAILSQKFHWVLTNVPYLTRGKQNNPLKDFCETYFPEGKNDLATVFLDRCIDFCTPGGTTSIVLPQNWLFALTYKRFREKLLSQDAWQLIARLGPGAFETISGEVVKSILFILSRDPGLGMKINRQLDPTFTKGLVSVIDVSDCRNAADKSVALHENPVTSIEQSRQLLNPDARVIFEDISGLPLLSEFADSYEGLSTGDLFQFGRFFWEFSNLSDGWEFFVGSVTENVLYGGREQVLLWQDGKGALSIFPGSYIKGAKAWGKLGVRVTQLGSLACTIYMGELFNKNAATIVPKERYMLLPIYEFCCSEEFRKELRKIDQRMNVMIGTMIKVPFDKEHWTKVAKERHPNGLPLPYSNDPTQWIFHGHPATSECALQVAVARLVGYQWPAELDEKIELSNLTRELIKKNKDLLPQGDQDGIVCIPGIGGEAPASERLLNLLASAYGQDWDKDVLSTLLARADHAGKSLESWLRDKFFSQHCQLFQHRPFIWQIWDGLRDGFSVLVNYHKLNRKNLENLIYGYLGDWIRRQNEDMQAGVDGAGDRLIAAENLKKKLELILKGDAPYDIFVRWKRVDQQPIGWEPDLNDGVRLNIRPFISVPDVGKKGAGCLRDKPNIKWDKDRGKDVETSPWYHLFNGDRINDHHLTLAEKRAARLSVKEGGKS